MEIRLKATACVVVAEYLGLCKTFSVKVIQSVLNPFLSAMDVI